MKKVILTSGKRKRAVARATLKEGKGIIRINSLRLEAYSPMIARLMIQEPLELASEISKKVDININVFGGGWHSQADAVRLAIARALVEFSGSKKLKADFIAYDRNLLVADKRQNEPHKPNDSKPRAARQKSYR